LGGLSKAKKFSNKIEILILGCSSADKLLSLPISFATFMKKLLKLFAT
jgi:hypothetical protein